MSGAEVIISKLGGGKRDDRMHTTRMQDEGS